LENIKLPKALKRLEGLAFQHCRKIKSIVLPENMIHLGARVFEGCESLSGEIVIPYGITEIRLNSFAGCTALAQVVIGKNVKEIHEEAFSQCSSFKKVIVSKNVKLIEQKAFYGCVAIDHVLFEAESEAIIEA
jgi:hypothetical protein